MDWRNFKFCEYCWNVYFLHLKGKGDHKISICIHGTNTSLLYLIWPPPWSTNPQDQIELKMDVAKIVFPTKKRWYNNWTFLSETEIFLFSEAQFENNSYLWYPFEWSCKKCCVYNNKYSFQGSGEKQHHRDSRGCISAPEQFERFVSSREIH